MKLSSLLILSAAIGINMNLNAKVKYPATPAKPVTDKVHNFQITDPYRWMEDKNAAETKEWSHSQHNFTVDFVKNNYKEVAGLKNEIIAYLDRDYVSSPMFKADREFFYARKKGEQQNKLYTRIKGKEILIFDPEVFDKEGKASISSLDLT